MGPDGARFIIGEASRYWHEAKNPDILSLHKFVLMDSLVNMLRLDIIGNFHPMDLK